MVLPAFGQPISMSNCMVEFALSNKPVSFSNLYNRAVGVPASGQISLSNLFGKSANINNRSLVVPNDAFISLAATTLSNNTVGTAIASWGGLTQTDPTFKPIYRTDATLSNLPYVEFTGTDNTRTFLSKNTTTFNYGNGGGSTVILLCRYNSNLIQYNRSIAHTAMFDASGTYEWIINETPSSNVGITTKWYNLNQNGLTTNTSNVPLGKWSLYVMRMINSSGEMKIYRNNNVIASRTGHPGVGNTTADLVYIGAQGQYAPGQNMDLHYAAIYTRPLSDTELTNIYNSVSGLCAN